MLDTSQPGLAQQTGCRDKLGAGEGASVPHSVGSAKSVQKDIHTYEGRPEGKLADVFPDQFSDSRESATDEARALAGQSVRLSGEPRFYGSRAR